MVYRTCFRVLGDVQEAEDAAQGDQGHLAGFPKGNGREMSSETTAVVSSIASEVWSRTARVHGGNPAVVPFREFFRS